ncbi:MAG: signal peptide peptidase SppA [Myxococcota bacterium]
MIGQASALLCLISASTPIPTRLSADVSDGLALRSNPAGLGFLSGSELRLIYGFEFDGVVQTPDVGGRIHSGGAYGALQLFNVLTLGAGYDFSDPLEGGTAERGLLGAALRGDTVSLGATVEIRDEFGSGGQGFVRLGTQWRPWQWVGFGFAVQDVGDEVVGRSYDVGVALRPGTERLLVSSEWSVDEGRPLNGDTLELDFLVQVEPLNGLTVGFSFDHDFADFNGQVRFDLLRVGLETAVASVNDEVAIATNAVFRARPRPSIVPRESLLEARLQGDLVPSPSFSLFNGFEFGVYGQAQLLLDRVLRSPSVAGAILRIGRLDIGWGKASELREGILRARSAGKRFACHLEAGTDIDYFVASACDQVLMRPVAPLNLNGISATYVYVGEGLDRLGVEVQAVRRGRYKTAPDLYTRKNSSDEGREAANALLDVTFDELIAGVASSRDLKQDDVRAVIDLGTTTPQEAVEKRLVDDVVYSDELRDWVRRRFGAVSIVPADGYVEPERPRWADPARIAVIYVDAPITEGSSLRLPLGFGTTSGADTIIDSLNRAREDPSIKGVVLRIDTPGGDAVASDRIARAVQRLARRKPVAASMGDIATSGGYFVAAPAGIIFAEPSTITGSIGVFSLRVTAADLLARLGIFAEVFERGEHAGLGSWLVPFEKGDEAIAEKRVDFFYDRFLEVISKSRDLSKEQVRSVAEGRVWSGRDAKERQLIDEFGGLMDAVAWVRRSAGLRVSDLVVLPGSRRSFPAELSRIFSGDSSEDAGEEAWPSWVSPELRRWMPLLLTARGDRIFALPRVWLELD